MSQEKQILKYLKAGHRITGLQALAKFQCMRLSARIGDLEEAGYEFERRMIRVPSGKHVMQYWLAT